MGFIKMILSGMGSPFVLPARFLFNLTDSAQKWLDLAQPVEVVFQCRAFAFCATGAGESDPSCRIRRLPARDIASLTSALLNPAANHKMREKSERECDQRREWPQRYCH
jgi:hypothetical protein